MEVVLFFAALMYLDRRFHYLKLIGEACTKKKTLSKRFLTVLAIRNLVSYSERRASITCVFFFFAFFDHFGQGLNKNHEKANKNACLRLNLNLNRNVHAHVHAHVFC